MEVSLGVLRKVKVDDHIYSLDVDSSGEQICWKTAEDHSGAVRGPGFNLRLVYCVSGLSTETHRCTPGFCTARF